MSYWYNRDNGEPEYNPPQFKGILTKEKLEKAIPSPGGKYQLCRLTQPYTDKRLGEIPAGTLGLCRRADGATNTRFIEFECPRVGSYMMAVKKVHIRVSVLTDAVEILGRVNIAETRG